MSVTKNSKQNQAAASWNATSSCLLSLHLQHHVANCAFYKLLKISLAHTWRPLHTLLELLLNIKGSHDLNYIQSQYYFYAIVLSLAQHLRLQCRMLRRYQKRSKKYIPTSNFETSSQENVTAKKPIGNMYFMYVDMAWFHSPIEIRAHHAAFDCLTHA